MPQRIRPHERSGRPVRGYIRRGTERSPWEALGPMSRSLSGSDQMHFDEEHYATVGRSYEHRSRPWKWTLVEIVKLQMDDRYEPVSSDYTLREGFAMTREAAKQMAVRAAQEHGLLPLEETV